MRYGPWCVLLYKKNILEDSNIRRLEDSSMARQRKAGGNIPSRPLLYLHPTPATARPEAAAQQQLAQECAGRPLDRPRSGARPSPLITLCPRRRAAPAAPYRFPGFFLPPRPRCARTQKSPRSAGFGVLGFGALGIPTFSFDSFLRGPRPEFIRGFPGGRVARQSIPDWG